jgi:hypothetical protein
MKRFSQIAFLLTWFSISTLLVFSNYDDILKSSGSTAESNGVPEFLPKKYFDDTSLPTSLREEITDKGLIRLKKSVIPPVFTVLLDMGQLPVRFGDEFLEAEVKIVKYGDEVGVVVNGVANTLFSKNIIVGINGFSDNVTTLASQQGLSLTAFKSLELESTSNLAVTNPQGLTKIINIRNSIPNPDASTIMQKVIPLNKIDDFTIKGYKPRGFVTTAANSKHLNTYTEIYDGMRLDYKIDNAGTQAFNASDNGCYVIRFKAANSSQATPAVNLPNPDAFPYTNHGFTSGMNDKLGVPEWKMPDAEITEGVIYRKNIDGSEVEYAIWDATLNKFILK